MDVKEIKKIDIHAYAALIYDFFPPAVSQGAGAEMGIGRTAYRTIRRSVNRKWSTTPHLRSREADVGDVQRELQMLNRPVPGSVLLVL